MLKIKAKQGQTIEAFARTAMMMMLGNNTEVEAVYGDVVVQISKNDTLGGVIEAISKELETHNQINRILGSKEFTEGYRKAYRAHKKMCGCGPCKCQGEFLMNYAQTHLEENGIFADIKVVGLNEGLEPELPCDTDYDMDTDEFEDDEDFSEEEEEEIPEREPVVTGAGGYISGLTPEQEAEVMVIYQRFIQQSMTGGMNQRDAYQAFLKEIQKKYPQAMIMKTEVYR